MKAQMRADVEVGKQPSFSGSNSSANPSHVIENEDEKPAETKPLSEEEKQRILLDQKKEEQRKEINEAEQRRQNEIAKEKKRRIEALIKRQEQMDTLEKTGKFDVHTTKIHTNSKSSDENGNSNDRAEDGGKYGKVSQTWIERAHADQMFADEYGKKDGELIMVDLTCLTREVYGINCHEEEIHNLAQEWNLAMSTEGFVLVKGHGIRAELFDELDKAWEDFFRQDEKMKMKYRYGKYGNDQGGYVPIGEEVFSDGRKQQVESYSFNRNVVNYLKASKLYRTKISSEYFNALEALLGKIHHLTARSLGLEDQYFFDKYYNVASKTSKNTLKLANYPSRPLTESIDSVVYGEHTDRFGFSIICLQEKDRSLQFKNEIKNKVSAWVTVDIEKSSQDSGANDDVGGFGSVLIIHAGDLISKWTGGYYKSTSHRVVLEPGNSSTVGRRSMVFYSGPNEDLGVDNSLDDRKSILPLSYLIERITEHLQP